MLTIDPEAVKQLQPELTIDEQFIWAGRPKRGIMFNWSDVFLIPLSFGWMGMVVYGFLDTNMNDGIESIVVPIPFLIFGLYFTIGRFLWDMRKRATSVYGLTTKRVIIKYSVLGQTIDSIDIDMLTNIDKDNRSNGSGSIELWNKDLFGPIGGVIIIRGQRIPTLQYIENVNEVYDKILGLQKQYEADIKL